MAAKKTTGHELDAADRNALPDSAYAFPRLRKEPLTDARHVRNAIARFDQVKDATDKERDEAFRRIKRAASKFDIEMTESRWQDLGKPTKSMKSSEKPKDGASKAKLYSEAKKRGVAGRSTMTKAELLRALRG
jgi:acyl-CoA reductase-like NAD-dependent aldehyde dehydrogenase